MERWVCWKRLCESWIGGKRVWESGREWRERREWMERRRASSNVSFDFEAADMSDVGGVWLWVCAPPRLGRPFPISTSDPPTQTRIAIEDLMWRVRKLGSDSGGIEAQPLKTAKQSNAKQRQRQRKDNDNSPFAEDGPHRVPSKNSIPMQPAQPCQCHAPRDSFKRAAPRRSSPRRSRRAGTAAQRAGSSSRAAPLRQSAAGPSCPRHQ
jgi:hypothetical protein